MPIPQTLNQQDRRSLAVRWPDGTQKVFSWAFLRSICPCAVCREEQSRTQADPPALTAQADDTLVHLDPVGRYGVKMTWADGHAYGIYTWRSLKELTDPDAG